ncbi:MAG: STAS domain-containing protein [Desulfococcaceae bacterium]
MEYRIEGDRLILVPGTDLVASRIEALRDFFDESLRRNPDVGAVALDVTGIRIVDSLGVNLIVGLFRQATAEQRAMELTGAGPEFMKVANFFRLPSLFPIRPARNDQSRNDQSDGEEEKEHAGGA